MNYWIGINSDPTSKEELAKRELSFWCMPEQARTGDYLYMYCPRSASAKQQGIFSLLEVTNIETKQSKSRNVCDCYKYQGKKLRYCAVKVIKIFNNHVDATTLKYDDVMGASMLCRRNFQGTVFELKEEEHFSIQALLALANS